MKLFGPIILLLTCIISDAQETVSPFDGSYWGIVLDHPGTSDVLVKENIPFAKLGRELRFDLYLPNELGPKEKRETVVILNGIGDQQGMSPMKASPAHTSWARLLAANGFVVITMESEVSNIRESFTALFAYLTSNSDQLHIDINNIGVQSFSANCREAVGYLMSEQVSKSIKAAVLYYGQTPEGQLRDDLPVYFVVAEKDIRENNYANLWKNVLLNKSPWTIAIARDMPHAFDFFSDTETSRRMILSTLSYWRDQLGTLPARTTPFSKEREIVAATYEGDQTRKLNLMREWMKEHPESNDAYALSAYASALMDTRDFVEAEKYLKKAIAIVPENKGNYLMMAVVGYAQGKEKEGDTNLALYEKDSRPEAFTYFYIADRLIGLKRFKQSAALYERALTFPNPHAFVYYNLGACYAMLGDPEKAFKNLFVAANRGFGTKEDYQSDENLQSLNGDKRWNELMSKF